MKLKKLVDKVLTDHDFYEQLRKDPEGTLQSLGQKKLTQQQIKALKDLDYESLEEYLKDLAKAFKEFVT